MDPRLKEAARTGNINDFYSLIPKYPYVLTQIDTESFDETPLHVAASEGQIAFAIEMMNLRPAFARALNQAGFSPMHVALLNKKTQLVLRLLKMDKDLVRVKGKEGKTPFHNAVEQGDHELLNKFLEACPECIQDVTVHDDTALHIALKCDKFETFEFLVKWILNYCGNTEEHVLNWKDEQGNTLLHIAAMKNNEGAVKLLMDNCKDIVDVNARNLEDMTASAMLNQAGLISNPMLVALENKETQLVYRLLKMNNDLVRVKGRERKTPFHHAAEQGDNQLLTKFLEACPECIQDVTVHSDTALHIALKSEKYETFKFLLRWILNSRKKNGAGGWEDQVLNRKDEQGNTLLHIAAMKKNREVVKLLSDECSDIMDTQARNLENVTALEYLLKFGLIECTIL